MQQRTLSICLALVFGCAVDCLAQFTPVMAKIRVTEYRTQSDGPERSKILSNGFFYRSSAGDVMQTRRRTAVRGTRRDLGRSAYYNASERKHYSLNHNFKLAELEHQSKHPLAAVTPSDTDNSKYSLGKETVQGLRCIIIPIRNSKGKITGKSWWALDVARLTVKTERTHDNIRRIWELYDIQFAEPDSSKFSIPSDYEVDQSKCQGCDNRQRTPDPVRK